MLLGVNGLRGSGTNEDMLLIARAVMKNGPKAIQARNWHEGARKAWAKRRAAAASTSLTPRPENLSPLACSVRRGTNEQT